MSEQANLQRQALQRALRNARKSAGLTQVDVATRLSLPQSFVSNYENGKRRLDLVDLLTVCQALQVNILDLLSTYIREIDFQ